MEQILTNSDKLPHERIYDLLFDKDEITWQTILQELVKSEQMDPWDIDISALAKKYIDMIKQMQGADLRISGKVILAAALLLKIKSNRLVGEDLDALDRLFSQDEDEQLLGELSQEYTPREKVEATLIPRTPQPRKRKVSIYDLMNALEKALEVKRRRVLQSIPPQNLQIPQRKINIGNIIQQVYGKIRAFFVKSQEGMMSFSQLIPSESKEDRIYTFIPLLHLSNQRKVELFQQKHFGDIEIFLKQADREIEKELAAEIKQ